MTVPQHPMNAYLRDMHPTHAAASGSSSIQPSVKHILDLARGTDQHIVRLYYLPTPDTNGFTTTHTLVSTADESRYPQPLTARSRSSSSVQHAGDLHTPVGGHPRRRISHLTRVSESERGIVHLARLRISTMIIATSSLPYLSHLVSLRLQGNLLTDIPLQIFRLPALRELDVSQNFLTEISGLIGLLAPTLEELFLQSNRLQSLPQQLGRLKRLRLLDIADNQLGCIPVEIQRLVSESFTPTEMEGNETASARTRTRSRSLWRVNSETEGGLTSHRVDDTQHRQQSHTLAQAQDEGSYSNGPNSPIDPHPYSATLGQGTFALNNTHHHLLQNEEGGHDDDDYVQIRQGMKCWARGNRFWQVKAPRGVLTATGTTANTPTTSSSKPISPITETTSILLAGSASPSAQASTAPSPVQNAVAPSPPPMDSLSLSPGGQEWQPPLVESGSSGSSNSNSNSSHLPQQHIHHRIDHNRYHTHQHQRQYLYQHQSPQPHPEHLVDRRGYSKDSYTSCSWTLSLADICSQIVGEKLYDDPHYFCHPRECTFKAKRGGTGTSDGRRDVMSTRMDEIEGDEGDDVDEEEGCMIMMIPEWMTEQLGLHHISEMRKSLLHSFSSLSLEGEANGQAEHDHVETIASSGVAGGSDFDSLTGHGSGTSALLDTTPPPMQHTLQEKEMEYEFCSVCQKRLYFSGLRWKGVGVMDERIVPLEWVACSVLCRAKAERGERRDHQQQQQQQQQQRPNGNGHLAVLPGSSASTSASNSQGGFSGGGSRSTSSDLDEENATRMRLPEGFQNGISTRVNHESRADMSSTVPMEPSRLRLGVRAGTGVGPVTSPVALEGEEYMRTGETVVLEQERDQQGNYRASVLYGLIKSRTLRRRTRALSL